MTTSSNDSAPSDAKSTTATVSKVAAPAGAAKGKSKGAATATDTAKAKSPGVSAKTAAASSGRSTAASSAIDDLTRIEGIGPKISELLKADGITTFRHLADTDQADLKRILDAAGSRFTMHDPSSWPEQSALAASGQWEKLKSLQENLEGGRRGG